MRIKIALVGAHCKRVYIAGDVKRLACRADYAVDMSKKADHRVCIARP